MTISLIVFFGLLGCILSSDSSGSSAVRDIDVERDPNIDPCWDYEPTK